jgi:hypothetical protein
MLAPIIMETPAAIEKNAVAEGMSRMMGRKLKAHYSMGRALSKWLSPVCCKSYRRCAVEAG